MSRQRVHNTKRRIIALGFLALCALTTLLVGLFGCSAGVEHGASRDVWHGKQVADDVSLMRPPWEEAVTRVICAETWVEFFPEDRDVAFNTMAQLVVRYVDEQFLIDWQKSFGVEYTEMWETTPSEHESYVAHDQGNPLANLAHGCVHAIEFALGTDGDEAHTDALLWDGPDSVVRTMQTRVVALFPQGY